MSGWRYNFPAHYNVPAPDDRNALRVQINKVREEAIEALEAVLNGEPDARIDEELLDCIHACETALRRRKATTVAAEAAGVVNKNVARGYYREPRCGR